MPKKSKVGGVLELSAPLSTIMKTQQKKKTTLPIPPRSSLTESKKIATAATKIKRGVITNK